METPTEEKIDGIESEVIVKLQRKLDLNPDIGNFMVARDELEYLLARCHPMQVLEHEDLRGYVIGAVERALGDVQCQCDEPESDGVVFVLGGAIAKAAAYSGRRIPDGMYELVPMESVGVGILEFSDFERDRPNGDG